jgi:hypothetical protein
LGKRILSTENFVWVSVINVAGFKYQQKNGVQIIPDTILMYDIFFENTKPVVLHGKCSA